MIGLLSDGTSARTTDDLYREYLTEQTKTSKTVRFWAALKGIAAVAFFGTAIGYGAARLARDRRKLK